ncbi:hypothetical protein [Cupriavidus sp. AU9028]|uniref:hypothetical protein n=1 Tax=Cupriavidus sp. AU9028 TaxID=2871157 RepID=UPI001C94A267|nr:hypothetical protein [Cupriavidus sp. AU9028]MBY4896695.1 hypothetical protein [Cupriavidus sp. AU9028]
MSRVGAGAIAQQAGGPAEASSTAPSGRFRHFKVQLPIDANTWARVIFYGTWCIDAATRAAGLLGPSLAVAVPALSVALHAAKLLGYALSSAEGPVALFDMITAKVRLVNAGKEMSRHFAAHQRVLDNLKLRSARLQQKKDRKAEARALREQANLLGGSAAEASAAACGAEEQGAAEQYEREAADLAAMALETTLEKVPFPEKQDCDGHLAYQIAEACSQRTRSYTSSKIACLRDLVIQGIKVAFELTIATALELGKFTAGAIASGLGVVMGIAHTVQGYFDYRTAIGEKTSIQAARAHIQECKAKVIAAGKQERLKRENVEGIRKMMKASLGRKLNEANVNSWWARIRMAYGGLSIANGAIAAGLAIALAVGVTTGWVVAALAVVTAVIAVAGALWLLFAVCKLLARWWMNAPDRREIRELEKHVTERPDLPSGELDHMGLEDLRKLKPKLFSSDDRNLRFGAALLVAHLQDNGAKGSKAREDRLAASSMLEACGVPKETRSLLKRASFATARKFVYEHLAGNLTQAITPEADTASRDMNSPASGSQIYATGEAAPAPTTDAGAYAGASS